MAIDEWPQGHELVRRMLIAFEFNVPNESEFVATMAKILQERCGTALLPAPGDSLALSIMRPKTAALAYDKVYQIPTLKERIPKEAAFYGASPGEIANAAVALFWGIALEIGIDIPILSHSTRLPRVNERESLRLIGNAICDGVGRQPTLLFETRESQDEEFRPGPEQVLTTAITNLQLVDEASLCWEQVLELRRDPEARKKYRRLVRWLDSELKSREPHELVGDIEERIDAYQWVIRKHGLNTALGVLSAIIDPKFLGCLSATVTATAIAGSAGLAALTGAGIAIGRALATVGTAYVGGVDARRGQNYEIAYLHDLIRRS